MCCKDKSQYAFLQVGEVNVIATFLRGPSRLLARVDVLGN